MHEGGRQQAEVCPVGCDNLLYEKVCDLREKKLDQEDIINDFQKAIDVLKKEREGMAKKQKVIETALKGIEKEMEDFQKEKQNALNQIDVVVTLQLHQIEYLVDGMLPEDLSGSLVFSNTVLRKLRERIRELVAEKAALKRHQKELRRQHIALARDRRSKEHRISELEARALDVQMLKFGQVIDLDVLDRMGASKGAEELREQLQKQEVGHAKELADWSQRIDKATSHLNTLVKENTECLNAAADLTQQQRSLESVLNSTQMTIFSDPTAIKKRETAERDRLVQVVNMQASQIEALKAEVKALRRKGGQMYA